MTGTKTTVLAQKPLNTILHTIRDLFLRRESVALGLIMISILVVQTMLLFRGFVSVSADEYSRVLLGASWAKSPFFMERYILDVTNVWQPWHFYLLGLALKIYDSDLFLTARLVTMFFSLISLGMLYLLGRRLFNRWVALLSVLIVGLLRPHVNLSLTPMVDMIFITFLISFLYFFLGWLESGVDEQLLLAALLVGLASGMRYDGWFTVILFSAYLGLRWFIELWTRRSLHMVWLLAVGLAWLPIFIWLWGNYIHWGDPAHFLKGHYGSSPEGIGPLTALFPRLGYIELLLQNGAFIYLLALVGIILSHWILGHRLWLYLTFSLGALVILILRGGTPGQAYKPHYTFPYLVLVIPFCAYAIYWALTAPKQSGYHRWQTAGCGILALMSLYNLWLVYLKFSQQHSWGLICLLALAGIALSYKLLDHEFWLSLTLSLIPLPVLIFVSETGLAPGNPRFYDTLYFIFLAFFYAYVIWRAIGVIPSPSQRQWQIMGAGILIIICLFNLWDTFFRIPWGMPISAIQSGLVVHQLFEEGALAGEDRVLVEVELRNYKGMQVMSNHPGNFILDRAAYGEPDRASFLLDQNSSPYEIGDFFTSYEPQVNPFSLDPAARLPEYLADQQIRLIIIKDPRLESLLIRQTDFRKIHQIEDYRFYYAADYEQLDLNKE
jgi:hypothetical protein